MVGQINQHQERRDPQKTPVFARHETFHPRFGWLKKGFDRATHDLGVFLAEDAPVRLGVGKNMVRSIRYWESAFKLLQDDQPTEFGKQLLGDEGWDPYLEDPASLWLLHWKLLEQPCTATAWYFAFNEFRKGEFTVEDLLNELGDYRDRESPRTVESSLKKDVSCLLRMYVHQLSRALGEESLDCPFTQMGLIHTAGDARHYTFRLGAKPTLPAEVIVYACLHYVHRYSPNVYRIPIAKLLHDEGSPGLAFRLTESALYAAIEQATRTWKTLRTSDTAGMLEFVFEDEPQQSADDILNQYYLNQYDGRGEAA